MRHESLRDPNRAPQYECLPQGWDHTRTWSLGFETAEDSSVLDDPEQPYRRKWTRFLEAVDGPGPLGVYHHNWSSGEVMERDDPIAQNIILAFAYALARAASGARRLSVFDWGGGLGEHYVLARKLFPEIRFDYHCQEVGLFCARGRRVSPEVTFYESHERVVGSYDLVVASGSLHLDEDWRMRLEILAQLAGGWIFITEVMLVQDHPSFVVRQHGEDWESQEWVFNREELLEVAAASGLTLVREFVLLPPFSVDTVPELITSGGFLLAVRAHPRSSISGDQAVGQRPRL